MDDLDDLFGKGLRVGDDIVAKAQFRARVRKPKYPVTEALVDTVAKKYEERLVAMLSDIEAELRQDVQIGKGGLYIDAKTGRLLRKATGGNPPTPNTSASTPGTTVSGQPRQERGKGPNPNYKRHPQGAAKPGSRGGKWYRDDHGNVRYGERPTKRFHSPAEPQHVIEHHQKYVGKTPFLPGSADAHEFEHFEKVASVAQEKGIFSDTDMEFIGWFHDNFQDEFLAVMGSGEINMEDIEAAEFDMEKIFSSDEFGSFAEIIEEFFRTMAEPYIDEDGVEQPAVFVGEDEFGNPEDADEVVDQIRGILSRYQEAMNDPDVQAAVVTAEKERQTRFATWHEALALRTDDYAPLEGDLLNTDDAADAALRSMVAMSEMQLFRRAKSGEVVDASMRGMWAPNASLLGDIERSDEVLGDMSAAQLLNAYTASRLNDGLGQRQRGVATVWNYDYEGGTPGKLSKRILAEYMRARGLEEGSAKYDLTKEQLERNVKATTNMVNAFNSGAEDIHISRTTVKSIAGNKSALQEAQERIADRQKFIIEALEAQEDDSFEMPETMAKGVWGSHNKEGHEAIDPSHLIDADNPDRGTWKPLGYQKKYLNWMHKVKRGIVAADAGMGKTPTIITFMEQLRAQGKGQRAILVLPPALMEQWPREIARFAPDMKDKILNLSGRSMEERKALLSDPESLSNAEYVILSSGTLKGKDEVGAAKMGDDEGHEAADDEMVEILRNLDGAMFIDECHMGGYKSPEAGRHKIARQVMEGREYAFGLTATPIPNDPEDLWHLSDLFAPGQLGEFDNWKGKLTGATYDKETRSWRVENVDNIAELNKRVKPFVFQKNITDPDVVEDMKGGLTDKRGWTNDPAEGDLQLCTAKSSNGLSQQDYFAHDGIIEHMVKTRIKEFVHESMQRGKTLQEAGHIDDGMDALEAHVREELKNHGRVADGYRAHLQSQAAISPALIDPSYKNHDGSVMHAPKIKGLCDDIIAHFSKSGASGEAGKGTVVFCSYPGKAFPIMRQALADRGVDPSLIAAIQSGVSADDRAIAQDAFNEGKHKVMFVGIKSGGAGLNLQKHANSVIFMDEPWSPADKRQAQGRVWRTGQKSTVYEKTFRMEGTMDGVKEGRLGGKQAMVAGLLGSEPPTQETFESSVGAEIEKLMGRRTSKLAMDSIDQRAVDKLMREAHRSVQQEAGGSPRSILQQTIYEEVRGERLPYLEDPKYKQAQFLAESAFHEMKTLQEMGIDLRALEPSPEKKEELETKTGTKHLTTPHHSADYKREWRADRARRNAIADLNSLKSMHGFYSRKMEEMDPEMEDYDYHQQEMQDKVDAYDRAMKRIHSKHGDVTGGEPVKKKGSGRKAGKAGERAQAENRAKADAAKAKAELAAVKISGAQAHALHKISPRGGKKHAEVGAKQMAALRKQGLVTDGKNGPEVTPLGHRALDRGDIAKEVSARKTKAAAKAKEKKQKQEKAAKEKKLMVAAKKKAEAKVKHKSPKGVEFLKMKHGLSTTSDDRVHADIDVPEHEAATVYNMLKRSKHKNWSEFIKEEIKPLWPDGSMKEIKSYMQDVMDALHHAGVVKKHKVK